MEPIKCHHLLNFPITRFIKSIDNIPILPVGKPFHVASCDPKLYLHEDIYEKLSTLGSLYSLVFSMLPGTDKGSIHVDLDTTSQEPFWPSLNIVIDGQGVMKWFNPTEPGVIIKHPTAGVYYRAWFRNYGDVIDEWSSGKIALVRTDTPHQTWNFDKDIRRIVTIRWSNRTSWEETINWFDSNFT